MVFIGGVGYPLLFYFEWRSKLYKNVSVTEENYQTCVYHWWKALAIQGSPEGLLLIP